MSQQGSTQPPELQTSVTSDTAPSNSPSENDIKRQRYYDELSKIVPGLNRDRDYPFHGITLSREDIMNLTEMKEHWQGSAHWVNGQQIVLKGPNLCGANLQGVNLSNLSLEEANLSGTNLQDAHLENTNLSRAYVGAEGSLSPANFQGAFFDSTTNLTDIILSNEHETEQKRKAGPQLVDIHWNGVNMAVADWSTMEMVGDEYQARQQEQEAEKNDQTAQVDRYQTWYQTALRSTRQLAVVLQEQGISEDAAHFAYRAQKIQRHIQLLHFLSLLAKHPLLSGLVTKHAKPSDYRQMLRNMVTIIGTSILFILIASFATNRTVSLLFYIFGYSLLGIILASMLFYVLTFSYVVRAIVAFSLSFATLCAVLLLLMFQLLTLTFLHPETLLGFLLICLFILLEILMARRGFWQWENVKKNAHRLYLYIYPDLQAAYGRYIFSLFLDILAGYGYRPVRSIAAYLLIIVTFASLYFYFGQGLHPSITPVGAFVFSITSFHGRGFFPGLDPNGKLLPLDHPMIVLAASEAVVGLIIEISFIATFTQRYFGK